MCNLVYKNKNVNDHVCCDAPSLRRIGVSKQIINKEFIPLLFVEGILLSGDLALIYPSMTTFRGMSRPLPFVVH